VSAPSVNDPRDTVLLARHGTGWRWDPNPHSRQKGSQRRLVPAVQYWETAESPGEGGGRFPSVCPSGPCAVLLPT
jgi:hypothetical protein